MTIKDPLHKRKTDYKQLNLWRSRVIVDSRAENTVCVSEQIYINFSGNDYLGLTQHPQVIKAFCKGIEKYGLGSGASALVSGYYHPHAELEKSFAEFLQCDRALLFNTGYQANLGVITTLANRQSCIFSDRLCHASLLDAILLSKAKHFRYPHKEVASLHRQLELHAGSQSIFLVTESVFSMEGDIVFIRPLVDLAKKYHATLIVDDAHGIGVLGNQGCGISEELRLNGADNFLLIVPLGKALGSMGAIVAGNDEMIESLIQFARTYRYSTAIPPAVAYATIECLRILRTENWRLMSLRHLIKYFNNEAQKRNLSLICIDETPIRCILVKDNDKVIKLQAYLRERGFLVAAIRPPTVPKDTSRIRISLNCYHTEAQIIHLLDLLTECHDCIG